MNTTTLTREELMAFIAGCSVDKWELGLEINVKAEGPIEDKVGRPYVAHVIRESQS